MIHTHIKQVASHFTVVSTGGERGLGYQFVGLMIEEEEEEEEREEC